jgi:hypothetical protein
METLLGLVTLAFLVAAFVCGPIASWIAFAFGIEPPAMALRREMVAKPTLHPIDLLDRWASESNVRLHEINRLQSWARYLGKHANQEAYRVLVTTADGRGRYATLYCGDRAWGLKSDHVEAVWEDDGIVPMPARPDRDLLWDEGMDRGV